MFPLEKLQDYIDNPTPKSFSTKEQSGAMRKAGANLFEKFAEAGIVSRKHYNWYHEHGLPDPANQDEILAYRIKEEKKRKAATEDRFWNETVVPNIRADIEEAKVEDFLLPAGEWDEVQSQNISNPSDIKIGFR